MLFKITSTLKDDIYAQYEAMYLGEEPLVAHNAGMYGVSVDSKVFTGTTIRLNTEPLREKIEEGKLISLNGVWSVYAMNPAQGALFTATKINL